MRGVPSSGRESYVFQANKPEGLLGVHADLMEKALRRGRRIALSSLRPYLAREDMKINFVPILIGLMLSPIAAAMAFLITYEEYSHHYTNNKKSLKVALKRQYLLLLFLEYYFY